MNDHSEDSLVEQPAIELFREFGWRKRQQSMATVRLSIDEILDRLPRSYIPDL
jgi:hypothetical protein